MIWQNNDMKILLILPYEYTVILCGKNLCSNRRKDYEKEINT